MGVVEGMESVVATVSGYSGLDRFKLIKLITLTGANYVGALTKSTTHLVCWQFDGRKYSLAMKLGTKVVNHQWFEECIRQGKRLPEDAYTNISGQQSVPISNLPAQYGCDILLDKVRSRIVPFTDPGSVNFQDYSLSRELEMPHMATRSNSILHAESASRKCKSRCRLAKACHVYHNADSIGSMNSTNVKGHLATFYKDRQVQCSAKCEDVRINEIVVADVALTRGCEIEIVQQRCECDSAYPGATQKIEQVSALPIVIVPSFTEVACVICWTDHSSTKGVLPCTHTFCYSCITDWAYVMKSRGRGSVCPLCKANFSSIVKVENSSSPDRTIYSEVLPSSTISEANMTWVRELYSGQDSVASVCYKCDNEEPSDLLLSCHLCRVRFVHSFCLDPPLLPWICTHCKDLCLLYQH